MRESSSVLQRAASSEKSGRNESKYQRTVLGGTWSSQSRAIALLTRESTIGKRPPLTKWSSVVARGTPKRFFTGPFFSNTSVYVLPDQSSKKTLTSLPSSGHFGNS